VLGNFGQRGLRDGGVWASVGPDGTDR